MTPRIGPTEPVDEFHLDNGLRVMLSPQPAAPTVSVWVWYRVGSKNEWPGVTGISHWVEHMMFNGSPKFPKGALDRAIMETGGYLNAFTDVDVTAYLSTVPADHALVPLEVEADRMTRARMTTDEVERERSVVLSERDGNENWPEFKAEEELYALAFRRHPYHWDALGYREDIQQMNAEKLAEYYRRFYGTRNATLVVAGRFDTTEMRATVHRLFDPLVGGGEDPTVTASEPAQVAERTSNLTGPGTTPFVHVGFRAPGVLEPQVPAAILLDILLGGENRMFSSSMWGRGGDHPSSRLYQALVATGLAVRATSEFRPRAHPGLFVVHAQAAAGVPLARLETALFAELDRLATRGPTPAEVREIRHKLTQAALLAYEGPTRSGFRLGYFALLGQPGFEAELLGRSLKTTPGEIRAAAHDLFRTATRNVVRYLPTEAR
ncbi:MAG TPA: pitrilysin family protein [Thermoplasmata archaeon]|nr:pitrilysin family protein [Thermoplasmata archaeon]